MRGVCIAYCLTRATHGEDGLGHNKQDGRLRVIEGKADWRNG